MDKKSIWKSYRFPIILVIGIVVGALLGVTLGEKATVLKPLGDIFLNLMFTIVVPMVFVSITTAVGNMVNMKRLGKILKPGADLYRNRPVCGRVGADRGQHLASGGQHLHPVRKR